MADLIIPEPQGLLIEQSVGLRPNPRRPLTEHEMLAANLYGGYAHLLVRTAAVRAEQFSEDELPRISGYDDAVKVAEHLRQAPTHRFLAMLLDGRNQVLAIYENAGGFHEGSLVDVVRAPFLVSSRAVIFVHNHPDGSAEPTERDIERTASAAQALDLAHITLLDHIILGAHGSESMLEKGLLGRR